MIDGLVKPTLAIDFDGVLNTYASGFQPDDVPDPPVRGALSALEAYADVFQIVIFSTRAAAPGGIPTIASWLNRNGFAQIPLTITAEKPIAHIYLDDRGWQFPGPGEFPTAPDLLAFKPWWDTEEQTDSFPEIDASTAAKAVASLAARAGAADPEIGAAVSRAVEFVGGILAGLDDRVKASPAIAGKLAAVMAEKDFTLEEAADDIKDSLRFAAVFDADRYTAAVAAVLALLEHGAGLDLARLRNYWLTQEQGGSRYADRTYIGINAVLAAPNGFQFELQFHTPQSVHVQAINRDLYRLIRSGGLEPAEQKLIEAQMRENNSFVADPPKVAALAPVVAVGALRADGEGEMPGAVHYRDTTSQERACATCSYYGAGTVMRCGMFDTLVSPAMVCDEWAEGLPGALPDQWQWDDLGEVTPPLISAAPGVTELSTMIAVKPRPAEAEAIAAPGGDPPENLHVTLAFLGEIEGDLAPIADALRLVAATHAPLEGAVGGYGTFEPPGVGILLPDVRGLVELRQAVCEALMAADIDYGRSHGFEAHMTVVDPDTDPSDGYLEATAGAPLHFDELLIVRGDTEIVAIPFTGALPVTAALVAAGEPFCLPAELRGKTDPIRQAFVKAVMTPALEQAGLTWDITNPLAADVISRAGAHVVGIAQTTQDDLMNVINVAHEQGLSIPDTAKAIRSHMKEASNVRATMIARCLPGETLVDAAVVRAVTRRWYEGDMAIMVTESGREFTATPNHPMLTSRGWRSAGEIDEGDDLICHVGNQDASSARDEDVTDPPATIAEIFVAASAVGVVERRRGGEPDFHGDGREGEVDIARPDGVLTIGRLAALYEHLKEDVFAPSDVVDGPRFCASCGHLLAVDKSRCLCGVASGYAGIAEDASDEATGDAEVAFDHLHGLACDEPFNDRRSVHVASEVGRSTTMLEEVGARHDEAAALNVALLEPVEDGGLVDPDDGGDFRRAETGEIELDRVVSRRLVAFAGYVFNLVTPHGYFTVNGGYTGNTELSAAVNGGSLAATKIAADATGATATKTWMTAPGAMYPRHEDYEGLDGQTVGLDEFFDVGGSPLQYPGDPDGDPGETINCRCVLEYSGDASGMAGDNIDAAGERRFSLEHHNRLLREAYARVDELEPKLAAVLQPILERAGEVAARRFEELATNHLTAAGAEWTPPAAEEILPINCEANADALGITSGNAEAGLEPLAAPPAGPGPGRPVVSFAETTDYEEFNAALAENARPGFLTIHTPEELARDKVFISPDGASGFVVSPEHDLQNMFRNPDGVPGAGRAAVRMGVQHEGALTLDAYDGFLPDLYQKEGFGVVGRMKFVDEYAPDGWRFDEYGHPDILFMAQNPDPAFEVKTFTDWDQAKAYSLEAARAPIAPEILDTADSMVARAAELEPATTAELSAIADAAGGEMSGLDFAVKSQPSLVRKISGDLATERERAPATSIQDVASEVNDTLRYPMTFSPGAYSNGVETAITRLERDGFKQIKLKNYWGNADYQGINGVFEKDGYRFELQFHTPDSFELKTSLHAPYEAYRLADATVEEKLAAWNQMAAEQAKLDVPSNVMGIGEKVVHPPPLGALPTPLQSPDQMIVNTTSTLDPGGNDIDAALSSISQQIQLPDDVAQIEAKVVGDPEVGGVRVEGYFTPVAKPGEQKQIVVRRLSDRYAVFTHEFGHALDNALAGEGQMFATQDIAGNGLGDWLGAVKSSQTWNDINDALEQSASKIVDAGGETSPKDLVYVNGEPYYRANLEYAINTQELFARSFVQWRAEVDPKIAEHVAEQQGLTRPEIGFWYWAGIDFEPVATALHELMTAKDALRPEN